MPPKGSHRGKSREVPPKRATPWNNFFKSHYTSFRNQNLGKKRQRSVRNLHCCIQSEAEKANYADFGHDTEIHHAESGELQGESEADNDKARELKSRC
ncbi:LOW QUALITY PROTEIN: hypothetical protein TorRG33x02_077370 [Trema orientale]|uniref:Uncharacterized protein n=1 Tax=Trema orientale TaxID=63057 RepID=A0A2P5FFB6_TREOI|nr:LOW QUALITY PROTEIN: hypothetical protein TorRG33x02_077370 [Trema orientale]